MGSCALILEPKARNSKRGFKLIYFNRNCNLCGSADCRQVYRVLDFSIVKCTACHFIYLNPAPIDTPVDIYGESYFRGRERDTDAYNVKGWDYLEPDHLRDVEEQSRRRMNAIESFVTGGRILDVGCGMGIFLKEASSRMWEAYGVDVSPFAVHYARETLALRNVRVLDVKSLDFMDGSMDAVTMFHLIEHVLYPKELVDSCHRILRPGGILVVETPDISSGRARRQGINWRFIKIPEHVNYFSLKLLSQLLRERGFTILETVKNVESTGIINKLCGGEREARIFYDTWAGKACFRFIVNQVRKAKEFVSGNLLKNYDHVLVLARKN